jgi:hypothetical protein
MYVKIFINQIFTKNNYMGKKVNNLMKNRVKIVSLKKIINHKVKVKNHMKVIKIIVKNN